jgi:alpha-amylase
MQKNSGSKTIYKWGTFVLALTLLACPPIDSGEDDGFSISPLQFPSSTFNHDYFGDIRSIEPKTESLALTDDWQKTATFYHVWVNAFRDSNNDGIGDIPGITQAVQIGFFDELGVDALWLSPIFRTAGESDPQGNMHGYDTADHYNINPFFGSKNDLRELISTAHAAGIKVIFDFVPNHVSDQHPWFVYSANSEKGYGDWFYWNNTRLTDWHGDGNHSDWHFNLTREEYYWGVFWGGMPDLNYRNLQVRKAMADVLIYWLNFGFDGIRVDAVKYIYENLVNEPATGTYYSHHPDTLEFFTEMRQLLDLYSPLGYAKMMVAENWTTNTTELKNYGTYGGKDSFHMTLDFYGAYGIRNALNNEDPTFLVGTGGTTGVYHFYETAKADLAGEFVDLGIFLSNHDNVVSRPATEYNSTAKSRLAGSLLLFSPGTPFLYYGNEIGMWGQMNPDINLRQDLPWNEVTNQEADSNSLLNWYQAIGKARAEYATLFADPAHIVHTVDHDDYAAVVWNDGSQEVLGVFNFKDYEIDVNLDLSGFSLTTGTTSPIIGAGTGNFSTISNIQVTDIPMYGTRLIRLDSNSATNYISDNSTDSTTYVAPSHPNLFIMSSTIPQAEWGNGLQMINQGGARWTRDVYLSSSTTYALKFTAAKTNYDIQYNTNNLPFDSAGSPGITRYTGEENIRFRPTTSGTYRIEVDLSTVDQVFRVFVP